MQDVLIFAADTLVRFVRGRILIHTTSSTLPAFESDNPMLAGWLCQFARPTPAAVALSRLPPADRPGAAQVLDYLRRSGTLVNADAPAAAERDPQSAAVNTRQHLRVLARSVYELSCDLHGLGPDAERLTAARTGIGIERRLMALLSGIEGLRQELRALRDESLRDQLSALGVSPDACDLKLHIGCGKAHLEGWINIDVHPAPLSMNILWGLPFASGSVRFVFVSHLLEHLFYPRDVRAFLADIRRVLHPEGVVRIAVPDIEQCIEAYTSHDRTFFASRRESWPWWPENPTRLEDFLAYAGAGPEPAYLFESHKYGYDYETLERVLREAGFAAIERSAFMGSAHEALRVDDASAVARARYGDRYYSLFVEARAAGAERPTSLPGAP